MDVGPGHTVATRGTPPTAPGSFVLGNILNLRRDPLEFLTTTARTQGDVVRYRLATYDFYLVTHPDGVQRIVLDNNRNYTRNGSVVAAALKPVFGSPLVLSDGESWFFRRRIMQPVFVHRQVANFAGIVAEKVTSMLDAWESAAGQSQPLDIVPDVGQMTLNILMASLFRVQSSEMTRDLGRATLIQSQSAIMRARLLFYPSPFVPTPQNRRLRAANKVLDRNIGALIHEHRAHPDAHTDLLGLLIQARDEETGDALSDQQLRDEVASFYFAGFSSSSNALLWAFYLLARHPEAMHRLLVEIDAVLGDRSPTAEDLPKLPYVQQILFETLRLYPPIYASVRKVLADDEILGYRIPAGSHVTISAHVTHRSPQLWDEPERFNPDRFEPELAKARPRYAYFPFLGGPHQCLGRDFFLLQAQLVIIMAAQRYRLEVVPGHVAEAEALITQRVRGSLPMMVHRR
ncbi:MAG: cytochrome P450 [Chloroflexota bacterium]|nr:cytochrome P450 [Chloroflexota bacterium]